MRTLELERQAKTCETPKSPPGDYNGTTFINRSIPFMLQSVKHLNPRQGITTFAFFTQRNGLWIIPGVKHLNPRQGITTRTLRPTAL